MTGDNLPTHYSFSNDLLIGKKEGLVPIMQEMTQLCVDIHQKAKEAQIAQNIPANIYYQNFDLFKMKQFALNEKPMNNYRLGKLVLNWIENYLENFD